MGIADIYMEKVRDGNCDLSERCVRRAGVG